VRSPEAGRPKRSEPEGAASVAPGRGEVPVGKPGPGAEPRPGPPAALPEQSREDTDAGWGEYPERADDRLYRDRPPHWDDF